MYFGKYLLAIFTIVFIYCTSHCKSEGTEFYEVNAMELHSHGIKIPFLENGENSMVNLQNNTEWRADENECTCKNGRCETTCSEWKAGACLRTKQVCVCDPEFGKYDDQKCIYCNCGKGFNCTIDHTSLGDVRKCTCPEGYHDYSGECAPNCSKDRACLNGGTCEDGKCKCKSGTHGPFCERIFWCAYECRPRLIVDCVYNQKDETYGCLCKNRSLVFDYKEWVCKPCPCGEGTCTEKFHQLRCDCKTGYKEFDRQCRKCDCGPDQKCELHWKTGEKICKCQKGYFEREGTCLPCECGHDKATCKSDEVGRKICICPDGYEDNLGLCEKNKTNCTCHPSAKCQETNDGFTCACEDGYTAEVHDKPEPGEPCIDIDECSHRETCPHWNYQKCINFPGSYMCQCLSGFKPVSVNTDDGKIKCEEYKVSWVPAGITIGVIVAFAAASIGFIFFLKHRELSSNSPGMELRGSR